ncbi:MAG: hypothetical protein ACOH2K_09625 [Burkholderiaceae bacterium]
MTSIDEVVRVLNDHPDLGLFGFGSAFVRPILSSTIDDDFLNQVDAARNWLATSPGTAFAMDRGSYAIKHMAEKACGAYIPNGAAIIAAILEGFEPVRKSPGPNCFFTRRT